jgi:hypothetical protein
VDARVIAVAIVLAMMAAAGSALVPALRVGGRDLTVSLKDGARDGTYRRSTLRTSLVAVQAALSMVLLVGTALFVRSLQLATAVDLGFDTEARGACIWTLPMRWTRRASTPSSRARWAVCDAPPAVEASRTRRSSRWRYRAQARRCGLAGWRYLLWSTRRTSRRWEHA